MYIQSLKWIQSTFAGVDAFCKEGRPRNYVLTKMVDIFAPIMSEYVFAYALSHFRYLDKYRENQKEHKWEFLPYSYICNRSILVLGTGSIGEGIAKAANGFGIKNIWGYNRTGKKVDYFTEIVTERSRLLECVSKADVIVNVLPATPLTLNFMDKEILSKINNKAILILSGRGTTFDIPALKELIAAGQITRTVIDVFPTEPLPKEDSFWTLPGLISFPFPFLFNFAVSSFSFVCFYNNSLNNNLFCLQILVLLSIITVLMK